MIEMWFLKWAPNEVIEGFELPFQYVVMAIILMVEVTVIAVLGLPFALLYGRTSPSRPPNPTWDGSSRELELAGKRVA